MTKKNKLMRTFIQKDKLSLTNSKIPLILNLSDLEANQLIIQPHTNLMAIGLQGLLKHPFRIRCFRLETSVFSLWNSNLQISIAFG